MQYAFGQRERVKRMRLSVKRGWCVRRLLRGGNKREGDAVGCLEPAGCCSLPTAPVHCPVHFLVHSPVHSPVHCPYSLLPDPLTTPAARLTLCPARFPSHPNLYPLPFPGCSSLLTSLCPLSPFRCCNPLLSACFALPASP